MGYVSFREGILKLAEFGENAVDGRNPKQPPGMYKTL